MTTISGFCEGVRLVVVQTPFQVGPWGFDLSICRDCGLLKTYGHLGMLSNFRDFFQSQEDLWERF